MKSFKTKRLRPVAYRRRKKTAQDTSSTVLALVALAAVAGLAALVAIWLFWPRCPPPPLIAGLSDDGLRGAPCPPRSLPEQDARKEQGVRPPAELGARLRRKFPLGPDSSAPAGAAPSRAIPRPVSIGAPRTGSA